LRAVDLSKKQKRRIIIPSVMGAFIVVNIIYWQLWMFWI